jgi:hypothetical protein
MQPAQSATSKPVALPRVRNASWRQSHIQRPGCTHPDHRAHLLPHLEPASIVPDTSRSRRIAEDGRYPTYVTVISPCTDTLRVFTKTIRVILQLARSVHPSQKHQGADVSSVHKSRNVDGMPPHRTGAGGGRGRREALWCAVHNALE